MNYDLSHLTQMEDQNVVGPIQDDEALFLYSFIKVCLIRNVVELGFQNGYSAINFLKAVGPKGKVVSVDTTLFEKMANNHFNIIKDVKDVLPTDLPFEVIDLAFYDCHNYESTIRFHENMVVSNRINDNTIIVLHDTGAHHKQIVDWSFKKDNDDWIHQIVERKISDYLVDQNWHPIHVHAIKNNFDNDEKLIFRHGLTILGKKTYLEK